MKTYTIVTIIITSLLFFIYKYSFSKSIVEEHYIVIDSFNDIEIREYNDLIYASFTPESSKERNIP